IGRVCVVGLGYVGLPTAAALAGAGHRVWGVDRDPRKLVALEAGCSPIGEPGLGELVARVVAEGYLAVGLAPKASDAFVIAVPTPLRGLARKVADLTAVADAADAIAAVLAPENLVVVESTCPPMTTVGLVRERLERASGLR